MPQISVTIAGKTYRMACGEGEEEHLTALGAEVDARVDEFRKVFGEIGDQRLIVMAAITTMDELSESRRKLATVQAELDSIRSNDAAAERSVLDGEGRLAGHLSEAAEAVEKLAARLERRG